MIYMCWVQELSGMSPEIVAKMVTIMDLSSNFC